MGSIPTFATYRWSCLCPASALPLPLPLPLPCLCLSDPARPLPTFSPPSSLALNQHHRTYAASASNRLPNDLTAGLGSWRRC